jgi:riboflavin kinase / FMN adenylyltransferase
MKVHTHPDDLPEFKNAVITTGTFDGVHKGHQIIIEHIIQQARRISGESVIITFEPHPRLVLHPEEHNLKLLTTLEEKIEKISALGVDHLVVFPFTIAFSQMSAKDYVHNFLKEHFNPKIIVIGYNHYFGHHRDGNIELLYKLAPELHFEVEEIPRQLVDDIEVSSTKIRIALTEGDIERATHLLDSYYSLTGTVIDGDKIGRTLGYPTANIVVDDPYKLIPADGVYAAFAYYKNKKYNAMLSIGNRPTLKGSKHLIEANLLDFNEQIYGEKLKIELVSKIRDQEKFDSLELLKQKIDTDKKATISILQKVISQG